MRLKFLLKKKQIKKNKVCVFAWGMLQHRSTYKRAVPARNNYANFI